MQIGVPVAAVAASIAIGFAGITSAQSASSTSGTATSTQYMHRGMPHMGMHGHRGAHGAIGTVTAVNGSTITITGKNGTTYTVDAGSTTAEKISTIPVSDIRVGDTIGVQGSLSGTTITAKHILDGIPQKSSQQ